MVKNKTKTKTSTVKGGVKKDVIKKTKTRRSGMVVEKVKTRTNKLKKVPKEEKNYKNKTKTVKDVKGNVVKKRSKTTTSLASLKTKVSRGGKKYVEVDKHSRRGGPFKGKTKTVDKITRSGKTKSRTRNRVRPVKRK